MYTEGTHTGGTYTRREKHMKGTYTWREIHTEGTCTRRDVHLEGYIHGGEIHMKEQSNKKTYTWSGHTYSGGTFTWWRCIYKSKTTKHTHGGDIHTDGPY